MATHYLSTVSSTPATRDQWDQAVAAYKKIDAEADAEFRKWDAARDRYTELTGREPNTIPFDQDAGRESGLTELNKTVDAWGDRVADAVDVIMGLPSPDAAALLWKLNYIIADGLDKGAESTPCWSAEFVAQTVADMRRLLTTEA